MDILTHTLSGVAAGTAVAAAAGRRGSFSTITVILAGALGGFLPDADAISLWHGFDRAFGTLHGLNVTGREIYFGKWTCSHHGAMHSIPVGLILALLLFSAGAILRYISHRGKGEGGILSSGIPSSSAFFSGYVMHLLGDIPTPGYVWGGIRLWWPVDIYAGGTDQIWWWNNYDIFLAVFFAAVINLLALFMLRRRRSYYTRFIPVAVAALMIALSVMMINNREYSYQYKSFRKDFAGFEIKSREEQKRILGNRLYRIMAAFDEKLPFNF